jgi:ABC-2 type transport system ATP-binding protein
MGSAGAGVELLALAHAYDSCETLQPLRLEIHAGETFGLLGPNGAGKTTMLSLLATLLAPSSGDALIFGHSLTEAPAAVRALVGLVPQEISLYAELSAEENLLFFGRLNGVSGDELHARADELLARVSLSPRRGDRVRTFSGGMRRRLNLACSLMHRPRLLLLDEPTVGVDPQSRESLFDTVKRLAAEGTTIVYTTHYMEEAERLCDRIAILDTGRIIALGTQAELLELVVDAAPAAPPRVDLGRVFMHLTGRELRD